ncbi:type II toxin-antitoxin system RelE/ParE family toxin [Sediminibacillus terrae]|uniref:type II toxin-antitoxin system RelE/ParE family toxin n=1 Tax=Sediminibacillus terrae TaxID=1562106 RepID=UPI001296285A|nr:type II toxin-antitoxin system RelE/ParE family toxin [Sediminibacillus terrae]
MNYEVIFYEDDRGRAPVKDFLDELQLKATNNKKDKQLLRKITLYIEILEKLGTRAGLPYTKNIGNGIWELRPKDHRVLFFGWKGNQIVLLHAFRKETKKTPIREIEQAEKEMKDWLSYGENRITG